MPTKNYIYDVAISFAEEDRNAALALALALEMQDKTVYYYPNKRGAAIGLPLSSALEKIYSKKARYAVVLFSPVYLTKDLTKVELTAIKKRMADSSTNVYLVPVMLAEVDLSEHKDIAALGYLKWEFNPKEIAEIIGKMLGSQIDIQFTRSSQQLLLTRITNEVKVKNNPGTIILNQYHDNRRYGK